MWVKPKQQSSDHTPNSSKICVLRAIIEVGQMWSLDLVEIGESEVQSQELGL